MFRCLVNSLRVQIGKSLSSRSLRVQRVVNLLLQVFQSCSILHAVPGTSEALKR
jgi:hypothetical protein